MKFYKLLLVMVFIVIFLYQLPVFSAVGVAVTDLTWENQGTMPNGVVWLFLVTVTNNETMPITIDKVTMDLEGSMSFKNEIDTIGVHSGYVQIDQTHHKIPVSKAESEPVGSRCKIDNINISIGPGFQGQFGIYAIMSPNETNGNNFKVTLESIDFSIGTSLTGLTTHIITKEKKISILPNGQVPDLVGAEAGPFSILGFSLASSNGERLKEVTIILRERNGRFWPGGSLVDEYGDLAEVGLYIDADSGESKNYQKFDDNDKKLKSIGRQSLPKPGGEVDHSKEKYNGLVTDNYFIHNGDTIVLPFNNFWVIEIPIPSPYCDIPNVYNNNKKSSRNDFFIAIKTNRGWGNPDTEIIGCEWANYVGFGDKFSAYLPESCITVVPYNSTSLLYTNPDTYSTYIVTEVTQEWRATYSYTDIRDAFLNGPGFGDALAGMPFSAENDKTYMDYQPSFLFLISLLGGTKNTKSLSALTSIDLYISRAAGTDFNPLTDLKPITNDQFSGLSVWYNSVHKSYFSLTDQLLPLSPNYSRWSQVGADTWKITLMLENGFLLPTFDGDTTGNLEETENADDEQDEEGENIVITYKAPGVREFKHGEHIWVRFLLSDKYKVGQQWDAFIPPDGLGFSGGTRSNLDETATAYTVNNPPLIFMNQVVSTPVTKSSQPFSVIGLNVRDNGANLSLAALEFLLERPLNKPDSFTQTDLLPLSSDKYSGIAVYKDNDADPRNTNGVFDEGIDTLIPLNFNKIDIVQPSSMYEFYGANPNQIGVHLSFMNSNDTGALDDDNGANAGADYFLVFRTSATADNGDQFRVAFGDPKSGDGVDPKVVLVNNNVYVNDGTTNQVGFEYYKVFGGFDYDEKYIYYCKIPETDNDPYYGWKVWIHGLDRQDRYFSDWITISSVTALSFENRTTPSQLIDVGSDELCVIGINIKDGDGGNQTLNSILVTCSDSSVLANLSSTRTSGLQLWYDSNNNGVFEPEIDNFITLTAPGWIGSETALLTLATPGDIEDKDEGYSDYFLIIKTNQNAIYGDTFIIGIPGAGIQFRYGASDTDVFIRTNAVTIGIPVIFEDLTVANQTFSNINSPLGIIGININDKGKTESLKDLTIIFKDTGTVNFNKSDLADLTGDTNSGILVWRDNGNGVFENTADSPIRFQAGGIIWLGADTEGFPIFIDFTKVITDDSKLIDIPDSDTGLSYGNDFFISIAPGTQIDYGDDFYAEIKSASLKLSKGYSLKSIQTKKITGVVINNTELTNLVADNQRLAANSPVTPVLKISVSDGAGAKETLNKITLRFNQGFQMTYLADITNSLEDGIQFYADANNNGILDANIDNKILLKEPLPTEVINNEIIFTFANPQDISDNAASKSNFFICVKTDTDVIYGDTFTVSIPQYGIRYSCNSAKESISSLALKFKVPMILEDILTDSYFTKADSSIAIPIIGIKVYDNKSEKGVRLQSLTVNFEGINGTITKDDFAPLTQDTYSGVSLWRDNNADGKFNKDSDVCVLLNAQPAWPVGEGLSLTLQPTPSDSNAEIPDTKIDKYSYFVVIRITSDTRYWQGNDPYKISNDAFTYYIDTENITFYEKTDTKTIVSDVGLARSKYQIIADSLKPSVKSNGFTSYSDSTFATVSDTVYKKGEWFYFGFEYYEKVDTPVISLKPVNPAFNYDSDIKGDTLLITHSIDYTKWYFIYKNDTNSLTGNQMYDTGLAISAKDMVLNQGDTQYYSIEIDNLPPILKNVYIDTNVAIGSDTIYKNGDTIVIVVDYDPLNDTNTVSVDVNFKDIDNDFSPERLTIISDSDTRRTVIYKLSMNDTFGLNELYVAKTLIVTLTDRANDTFGYVNVIIDNTPPIMGPNLTILSERYYSPVDLRMVDNDTYIRCGENVSLYYRPSDYAYDTNLAYIILSELGNDSVYGSDKYINFTTASSLSTKDGNLFLKLYLEDKAGNAMNYFINLFLDKTEPFVKWDTIVDTLLENIPFTFKGKTYDVDGDAVLDGLQATGISMIYITIEVDTGNGFVEVVHPSDEVYADYTVSDTVYNFSYTLSSTYGEGAYKIIANVLDKAGNLKSDSFVIEFKTLYNVTNSDFIDIQSDPTPIIGIAITGSANQTLDGIILKFISLGNSFSSSDLMPLNSTSSSGILVYKDNGNIDGVFDSGDSIIPLADGIRWNESDSTIKLVFKNTEYVNTDNDGANKGIDYFIALRSSLTMSTNDSFIVQLPTGGIEFNKGINFSSLSVGPIYANPYISFKDLTDSNFAISVQDETIPLIGIDLCDNGGSSLLYKIRASFLNIKNFSKDDFKSLSEQGVCLILDSNNNDTLDSKDKVLPIRTNVSWSGDGNYYWVDLELIAPMPIPNVYIGDSSGIDVFLAVRPSSTIGYNDSFKAAIFGDSIIVKTDLFENQIIKNILTHQVTSKLEILPPTVTVLQPKTGDLITNNVSDQNVDFLLVIDVSGSMGSYVDTSLTTTRMDVAKSAAHNLVNLLGSGVKIGLVSFTDYAMLLNTFTNDKTIIHNSIDNLTPIGGTYYSIALDSALYTFKTFGKNSIKRIVFLSDGAPMDTETIILDKTKKLVDIGVCIDAIGFGGDFFSSILQKMAVTGNGQFYNAPDVKTLEQAFLGIGQSLLDPRIIIASATDVSPIKYVKIGWVKDGPGIPATYYNVVTTDSYANWKFNIGSQNLSDGKYVFYIATEDIIGNKNSAADSFTVYIISTLPSVSLDTFAFDTQTYNIKIIGNGVANFGTILADYDGDSSFARVSKVRISVDNGISWKDIMFAGDKVDNDKDGLIDEESGDSLGVQRDWLTGGTYPGDFWADDPSGIAGMFDPGTDEVMLADAGATVPYFKYTGNNNVLYQGATVGVNTLINSRIYPLIDEDISDTNVYDNLHKFVYYFKPTTTGKIDFKIEITDKAGNRTVSSFSQNVDPALRVEFSDLTENDTTIDAEQNIAVLKFNAMDVFNPDIKFSSIKLVFRNPYKFNLNWLEKINNTDTSGIQLYIDDTGVIQNEGIFDFYDKRINIGSNIIIETDVKSATITIPVIENIKIQGLPAGTNIFVAIRLSGNINTGDSFTISIPKNSLNFSGNFLNQFFMTDTIYSNVYFKITNLTYLNQYSYKSAYIPVFGLNTFTNSANKLNSLKLKFITDKNFSINDLNGASGDSNAGITLWKKNSPAPVAFDFNSDNFIASFIGWQYIDGEYYAYFNNLNLTVPDSDVNNKIDYIILLKTSPDISAGDRLQAVLRSENISFNSYSPDNINETSYIIVIADTNSITTYSGLFSNITSLEQEQVIVTSSMIIEGEAKSDSATIIKVEVFIDTAGAVFTFDNPCSAAYNSATQRWYYLYTFSGDTTDYILRSRVLDSNGFYSSVQDTILIKYRPGATDVIKPLLTNLYVIPNPFSPNGDGYQDTAILYFNVSEYSKVTIQICPVSATKGETITLYDTWFSAVNNSAIIMRNDLSEGEYLLKLVARDKIGNKSKEASVSVKINIAVPVISDIFVNPNPFTPNGDGINDNVEIRFKVSGLKTPFLVGRYRIYDSEPGAQVVMASDWTSGPDTFSSPVKIVLIKEFQTVFDIKLQMIGTDINGSEIVTQQVVEIKTTDEVGKRYSINYTVTSVKGFSWVGVSTDTAELNNNSIMFRIETDPGFALSFSVFDNSDRELSKLSVTPLFNGNGIYSAIWTPQTLEDGNYKYIIKVSDADNNVNQIQGIIVAGKPEESQTTPTGVDSENTGTLIISKINDIDVANNNYELRQGEFRLNVTVSVKEGTEKQKRFLLYMNEVKLMESQDFPLSASEYTFLNVLINPANKVTTFKAIGYDLNNNKSVFSVAVTTTLGKDIIAVGITGKSVDDNQPSFNPAVGQTLKINLPAETSSAKMEIFTMTGNLIKIVNWDSMKNYLEWSGRNDASSLVKNGLYIVRLRVTSSLININKTFPIAVVK